MGGEGIGQLHETASGGTGSVDTVMHELEAGGGDGNAAGQQVPAVADAAGAIEREENERLRRAAEAAGVAGGSSQADIYVMGAIMVRGSLIQAQQLTALLGMTARWRDQIGDSQRGDFQLYKWSKHLEEAAAARAAGGWLKAPGGGLWRFDVAGKGRDMPAATGAPVRSPAVPRMPGAPGCRPSTSAWQNPLYQVPRPAHTSATDLSELTAAVSKEVTAAVTRLLENHREQEKALLQAALQAAQQALQEAAERAAEQKAETEQLKAEIKEMKVKIATLKQRPGATRPGEPQPPPAWMPDTETQHTRQEKLLSELVKQVRVVVVEGKAAQSQLVGQLGHVTGNLDQITAKFSFLEQNRRLRTGSSRSLSTGRASQQARGKSPTFSAGGGVVDVFAQPPAWPPPGVSTAWPSPTGSKLAGSSSLSPFLFGQPATEAGGAATMSPGQLVQEPPPASDPKSESESTDEEDDRAEEEKLEVCYFSAYGQSEDEEQPRGVYEVTPKLDSGGTTPTKPRPVPAPNVRACSKSSPSVTPRKPKIKRLKSPGDTPGREVVVRQNATELMDEDVMRWVVAAAESRKELVF